MESTWQKSCPNRAQSMYQLCFNTKLSFSHSDEMIFLSPSQLNFNFITTASKKFDYWLPETLQSMERGCKFNQKFLVYAKNWLNFVLDIWKHASLELAWSDC